MHFNGFANVFNVDFQDGGRLTETKPEIYQLPDKIAMPFPIPHFRGPATQWHFWNFDAILSEIPTSDTSSIIRNSAIELLDLENMGL
jgi:hypothetical protein